MVTTVAAEQVPAVDIQVLESAAAQLTEGSQVRVLLDTLARALGRGVGAALLEQDHQVTPNEAADLLGMSRPHLLTFLDAGALAFTRVGSHRRIGASDLADFAARREAAGKFLAEAKTGAAQTDAHMISKMAPVTPEALAELDAL